MNPLPPVCLKALAALAAVVLLSPALHAQGPAAPAGPGLAGFDKDRRTELPNFGPHFTSMTDPGNRYSRRLEEAYVSSALPLSVPGRAFRLNWKGEAPKGSELRFEVRSAAETSGLGGAAWRPAAAGGLAPVAADDRWLQYRVRFLAADAAVWPVLTEVAFTPNP